MLDKLTEISTDSVLSDDTQHINLQIIEAERRRFRGLRYILFLQAAWTGILMALGVYPFPLNLNAAPVFVAAVMMQKSFKMSKLKSQHIAKCMLYYTLFRSFVLVVFFVMSVMQMIGYIKIISEGPSFILMLTFVLGINTFIELVTVHFTLQVLRFTNQYILLINRKMSRGVTEDDLQYNF